MSGVVGLARAPGRLRLLLAAALLLDLPAPSAAEPQPWPPLYAGERLRRLTLAAGQPVRLDGWTRNGRSEVYTLPVTAGQSVDIRFDTPSRFIYMIVFDLSAPDDDAIFGSDTDGKIARLVARRDTTWLIRPYFTRMARRRGLGAPYTIVIESPTRQIEAGP